MTFLRNIDKYKNKTAIITDTNLKVSYKDLYFNSKSITQDLTPRSLVFLLSGNNMETIFYYVGLINSKNVISILDKDIKIEYLKKLIKIYKPNYLVLPSNYANIDGYFFCNKFQNYKVIQKSNNKKIDLNKDLAILLNTSGSTGSSKLVRQSYENYYTNSESIIKKINLKSEDSVITTLPINYTFGLSIINTHLISGSKIILNDHPILQKDFWMLYKEHKPSFFYGVPYMFEIISKLKFEKLISPKLKSICQAGGKLNDNLFSKIVNFSKKNKLKFYSMYGQTEATARMSILHPKYASKKIGSIGKAISGGKFYLIDNKKKRINLPNKSGQLVYEGRNVSMGYAKKIQDLKLGNKNNYRILTGDIATFDKDGFYFIIGRKKRFIKILGKRINLDEVETIIEKKGYESQCKLNDDYLLINICSKKVNMNSLIKKIAHELEINSSLVKIKYIKKIKRNKFGKKIH